MNTENNNILYLFKVRWKYFETFYNEGYKNLKDKYNELNLNIKSVYIYKHSIEYYILPS